MIFDQLTLNQVSEIRTNNIGNLSSVAAVFVRTSFSMKDSAGVDLTSLREELRQKSIDIFSDYFPALRYPEGGIESAVVPGVELLPDNTTVLLERVEFVNSTEECERVEFKKVFFIPLSSLEQKEDTISAPPAIIPPTSLVKICNYSKFKTKVNFIETFIKINYFSLQKPNNSQVTRGINFRKFSHTKRKLTSFINLLDEIVNNNINKNENIIIYFSQNAQTVSKITFENDKTGIEREVFSQTPGQFNTDAFEPFNDARANFIIGNFDSIYPDLLATSFKRNNIDFQTIIEKNFFAPGVSLEGDTDLSQALEGISSSTIDAATRLQSTLSGLGSDSALQLADETPFKTSEQLAAETLLLNSRELKAALKKDLKEATISEGKTILREFKDFEKQLSGGPKKKLNELGRFINSVDWEDIVSSATSSISSKYKINNVLDESFIKRQLAETVSKNFTGERFLRELLQQLNEAELHDFTVFYSSLLLEQEGTTAPSGTTDIELIEQEYDRLSEATPEEVLENPEMSTNEAQVLQFEFNTHELASESTGPTRLDYLVAPQATNNNQDKKDLFFFALNPQEMDRLAVTNLIIRLSDCDRQKDAEIYTKMILFSFEQFEDPTISYFDNWSEFVNSWDSNNLNYLNSPNKNNNKFKLFPLNLGIPDIRSFDLFRFIFNIILSVLYTVIFNVLKSIIKFALSLIPESTYDFEPGDFTAEISDLSQTLADVAAQAMQGVAFPDENKRVLSPESSNQKNNTDLINFFKDAANSNLLGGSSLMELLSGNTSDDTIARTVEYFKTIENPDLAQKIKENPEILSEAGAAIGNIANISGLLDALDSLEPIFIPFELSPSDFVESLDLCSDPEASDILGQLCTDPNPVLRQQLLDVLEQQRESDRQDSAKLFGYLADPSRLTREIEAQIPNLTHPSLTIPQLVKDGQLDQVPVVKNSPVFALGRDDEALLDNNLRLIRTNLEILDSCLTTYGTSLVTKSNKFNRNKEDSDPEFLQLTPGITTPGPLQEIASRAFANDLFLPSLMPEEVKKEIENNENLNNILNAPISEQSPTISFDIGAEFYRQEVFVPLQANSSLEEPDPNKVLLSSIFNSADLRIYKNFITSNGAVRNVVRSALNGSGGLDLSALAANMKQVGDKIVITSLEERLENSKINLQEVFESDLGEENEFNASRFLPSGQKEEIIDDYLSGSFSQEKTYKRFIEDIPEYSELLLAKTDNELVCIKETIKTIIKSIAIEEAHIFSQLKAPSRPFTVNDTSTSIYNSSSLKNKIQDKINLEFSNFSVKFFNIKIYGYNAISYYLYEVEKISGNLQALNNTLGRIATPKDLMSMEIQKAIQTINESFDFRQDQLEGVLSRSIIYNFQTPPFFSSVLTNSDFIRFLLKSTDENTQRNRDGQKPKNIFLTSNLSFEVVLKPNSEHFDTIQSLNLEQINQQGANENVNNFFILQKNTLKRLAFDSLKNGEAILLDYDDVFSVDFKPSEDKLPLMASVFNFAIPGEDFQSFIFENFTIKPVYRVFATLLTKENENVLDILDSDRQLILSEQYSLGLFRNQKISSISSGTNTIEFNSPIQEGRQINGAGFVFAELASYQGPLLSEQTYTEFEDPSLIRRFMKSEENSSFAQDFKKNPSINILLSCILPYSNIINEATSYTLERLREDASGETEALLRPIEEQTGITQGAAKRILSNVE